ncbi:GspE/PulE family protein [Alteromonas facilis]|uniref:GspE/PulE family protein n=1 Tax=Alteromonas facilis TaxID=2048004 RepID=UPI000C28FE98|nr:type II/IV secretion system protein [Alteromonas facilis]
MKNLEKTLSDCFGVEVEDLNKAKAYQEKQGGSLENILVNMGALPSDQLPLIYSTYFDIPCLDIADWLNEPVPLITETEYRFLINQNWVPLNVEGNQWTFACLNPVNRDINQWIAKKKLKTILYIATEGELQVLMTRLGSIFEDSAGISTVSDEEKLIELASEAPIVNLLNSLLIRALKRNASDMHIEPIDGQYRARFRIDGVLHEAEKIIPRMQMPLITRLKILSGMDIAERRRPQDGKIETKVGGEAIDIRVSSLPLNEGESIVLRFLRKESVRYDMDRLHLSEDLRCLIEEDISSTAGVILLTGPTGSGKTTTLYTLLNKLNSDDVKIITLEDPVEYQLEGINQVQVNSEIGFTFASGLRTVLRQDPDIIMVGEIRDAETAKIAMQSALTGHLVFSTLHTNDAPSAYTRLVDLGVDEFLLNSAVLSVVAQRLVRKLCENCARHHKLKDDSPYKSILEKLADLHGENIENIKTSTGCQHCDNTGYVGRVAIAEYLRCDDDVKALKKDDSFSREARDLNAIKGLRTLKEDGFLKVLKGVTTISEVLRVAG